MLASCFTMIIFELITLAIYLTQRAKAKIKRSQNWKISPQIFDTWCKDVKKIAKIQKKSCILSFFVNTGKLIELAQTKSKNRKHFSILTIHDIKLCYFQRRFHNFKCTLFMAGWQKETLQIDLLCFFCHLARDNNLRTPTVKNSSLDRKRSWNTWKIGLKSAAIIFIFLYTIPVPLIDTLN